MSHTPGPWKVHDRWYIGPANVAGTLAEVKCGVIPASEEDTHEANARLIAAAPDLLQACKAALKEMRKPHVDEPFRVPHHVRVIEAIAAAIAKAEASQ